LKNDFLGFANCERSITSLTLRLQKEFLKKSQKL
jgi:hypothetical protein